MTVQWKDRSLSNCIIGFEFLKFTSTMQVTVQIQGITSAIFSLFFANMENSDTNLIHVLSK